MKLKISKKVILSLIKREQWGLLEIYVKILPRGTYQAVFRLMQKGYLNRSYEMIKDYIPKAHEIDLKSKIESMMEIKDNGLKIEKVLKKPIKDISVLFTVHNSLPYDKTGYALRTQLIASTLKKYNIDLTIATRPGYPWDLQKHRELTSREQKDDINGLIYERLADDTKEFKKGPDSNYIGVYADAIEKQVKQNNISIIHAHSNYLNALSAIKAANKLKIPSVYELRGLWHKTRVTLDANYKHSGMYEYEEIMEKTAVDAADAVVTISEALKDLIISWGIDSSKVYIIPNAVDTRYFSPTIKNEQLFDKYDLVGKTVIGFIGTLSAYEGLKELIQAVDELIDKGLNLVLMIVGDGREKDNLENLAKSKHIIFTGRVPFEEVKEYYTLFDICPFPRNNVEICRYVPPLKILEAMAMQKAVIISNIAPLIEIIDDGMNGFICNADDVESLKTKIVKLYYNDTLCDKFGENARSWVEKNRSIDSMGMKYKALYKSFQDS